MKYTLTLSSLISSHKTRTFKYKFQLAQHSQVPSLLTPVLPLNHLSCPSCSQPTTSPCRSSTALPSVCTPSSSSIRPRVTTARLNYTTISIRPAKVNKTTTWPPYSTAPPATPTRVSNHILQHRSLRNTLQKHSDPLLPASLPKRPPQLSHLPVWMPSFVSLSSAPVELCSIFFTKFSPSTLDRDFQKNGMQLGLQTPKETSSRVMPLSSGQNYNRLSLDHLANH